MKRVLLYILVTVFLMIFWAAVIFIATLEGWLHKPITKQRAPQAFINAVDREIEKQFVGNFALATFKRGMVEQEKFYSVGRQVDRNTVFQISSLSKWVSAFGVMKLVEDGRLHLDTPVSRYLTRWTLPSSEFNNEEVTVRRLLSHTAGLTDELGYSGFEPGTPVQSIEQSLTKASDADPGIDGAVRVGLRPGTEFKYSGGGYTLLQLLVEEVSGQSFESYMKESVFVPLKMKQSTYVWDHLSPYALAEFYNGDKTKAIHYRYTALAATSLYTSLADLELFFKAHLKGDDGESVGRNVVTPATLEMMRKPHGQQMGVDIWGLGVVLFAPTENNDFIIGHDGRSTPPINTAVRLNPQTGDGIIILETGSSILATRLASEWVFWKEGKVDTFLFPMLLRRMAWTIVTGWIVIVAFSVIFKMVRKRSSESSVKI